MRPVVISVILLSLLTACAWSDRAAVTPSPTVPAQVSPAPATTAGLSAAMQMHVARATHSATLLPDGNVLIAGGFRTEGTREIAIADAELYDPTADQFAPIAPMTEPRSGHTATLLPSGDVLIVGGWGAQGRTAGAELYHPGSRTFEAIGALAAPRASMTATLLPDGRVAIIGGDTARNTAQRSIELYDPTTRTFAIHGALTVGRSAHSATLLPDGTILVAGGTAGNDQVLASAERYTPTTETSVATAPMLHGRYKHAAVALADGQVLLIGGSDERDWRGMLRTTERYDPATGAFTGAAPLQQQRFKLADGVATLGDGSVLVGGGNQQIERLDPSTGRFRSAGHLDMAYYYTVLTPLADGRILFTGGYDGTIHPTTRAWIYTAAAK